MTPCVIGVDVGTSSSKGVLVGLEGQVLAAAARDHSLNTPAPGQFEIDGDTWWQEFCSITAELVSAADATVEAVAVSGMGPCVLLSDQDDHPVRPAILYGIDTRAGDQIRRLESELGPESILERCGTSLTSQAAGPKIAWVAEHEPDVFAMARRFYMPHSWLVRQLTGRYILDHHSASQCTPLYDSTMQQWDATCVELIASSIEMPELLWSDEVAGTVSREAAVETGLPAGIPVLTGTIDAWAEAISVGAHDVGDLMLMYGTTMFLINTVSAPVRSTSLWGTVGAFRGTYNLAGGMATSGAVTGWLRDIFGTVDYADLLLEAQMSGPGANGLLMLPYFAGERTPLFDPDARGVLAGLTLRHNQGDIYRAALEASGFGARHNIEAIEDAGGDIRQVTAVGGGTQGRLWPQIVSDITERPQQLRRTSVGACFGDAYLAARTLREVDIESWNPVVDVVTPEPSLSASYRRTFDMYRRLYSDTAETVHFLARGAASWPTSSGGSGRPA